ncbi:DUF5801 repeats-in-toxin domain-containing protein [Aminobacter sp. AP02]|uniref:DUF5801 repeats-in-toxin domain-containing protein n=1 Tax=Aminobacter sp. AP02 TaxID=2135737 RepID=UPI000D6AD752|nr:DUF5801 repeats-in-toxin domain-containing protein [Aminobacter sp. AP02]PWK76757.1 VCBS repeat-containing protein [Aminobacter sp. AP02]
MATSVEFENLSASAAENAALPEGAAQPAVQDQIMAQAADPVPVDAGSGQPVQAVQPAAVAPLQATPSEFVADASNVVHLPANISIDNIKVDGNNLVLEQADGTLIVIKDAAANVPTFLLGDVEVPRVALIAALEAGGINVAFGADGSIAAGGGSAQGSGGNFEIQAGGIGNGFDLSDLLPPTALMFPQYEGRELVAGLNADPEFTGFSIRLSEEGLSGGNRDNGPNPFDTTNERVFTGNFGATDSNGDPLTYSLGLPDPVANAGITSHGAAVVWTLVSPNLLEGRVGDEVVVRFTIADAKAGSFQVEILGPIDHPSSGIEDVVGIVVPVTVKDPFGGSATANVTLQVEDDSPEISGVRLGATAILDETIAGTPSGFPINVTSAGSILSFSSTFGADGAAAGGGVVYALTLSGNTNSGLKTAIGDFPITLVQTNSTTITGTFENGGTQTAFTVKINADGSLTVTQNVPLEHNTDGSTPASHNDQLNLAGLVNASVTITDFDNDSVSGGAQIGGAIIFEDDGPKVSENKVVLLDDDALGGNVGGVNDDVDNSNVSGTLGHNFGADGGSIAWLTNGAPAGFEYKPGANGSLEVFQNGTKVLTITLDSATGAYTVTQNAPIMHAAGDNENNQNFTLTYQVTDNDGDTANGTLQINVDDDTPTIAGNGEGPTLTVDETVLGTNATASFAGSFISSAGADGLQSITYALSVVAGNAGLVDTATGQQVVLSMNGTTVEGKTTGGVLVFTVKVDANGDVTLDQIRAVKHADVNNHDESVSIAQSLIKLTATITDKDGDSNSATLNIGDNLVFKDDGPSIKDGNAAIMVDEDDIANLQSQGSSPNDGTGDGSSTDSIFLGGGASATGSLSAVVNFGADGPAASGAYGFTSTALTDMAAIGLQSKGVTLSYAYFGGNLIAYADNGNGSYNPLQDRTVFSLSVNSNSGNFTFKLFDQLDHVAPPAGTADENTALKAGNGSVPSIDFGSVIKATDGDGDSVVLGGKVNVTVTDDIPQIFLTSLGGSVVHDETAGLQGDDTTSLFVAGQFGSLEGSEGISAMGYAREGLMFAYGTVPLSQGADEPIVLDITLRVVGGQGQDSGLKTTAGASIFLYVEDGLIVGRVGGENGAVAFAVAVDDLGGVSIAQYMSLQHPTAGDGSNGSHDEPINLNNLVEVVLTAKDNDGDTVEKSINIGNKISFEDDGPKLTGGTEIKIVNEDDIDSSWSQGTSPHGQGQADPENDGDNSYTNNQPGPNDPAYTSGSLAALVNAGADNPLTFEFKAGMVEYFTQLGLYSKESANGDGPNGLKLTYATSTSGDWVTFRATEPDSPNSFGNSSNPVFELRLNTKTGQYEFRLYDELIHKAGDGENFDIRTGDGTTSIDHLPFGDWIIAKDGDGDWVSLGSNFQIKVLDDVPEPEIRLNNGEYVVHDETAGTQNSNGADDTNSLFLPSSVRALFAALENSGQTGDDPDVDGVSGLSGKPVIGYARDGSPIVSTNGSEVGADSPAASASLTLKVTDGTSSGLFTTEGQEILLYKTASGLVVGRIGGANGTIAFAIAIEQGGEISVAQYLSIRHDDRGDSNEHNDNGLPGNDASPTEGAAPIQESIATGAIKAVYTITDSDGDTRSAEVDIGGHIRFLDDGPTVDVKADSRNDYSDIRLTLDETTPGGNPDDNTANTEWSLTTNPAAAVGIGQASTPTSAGGTSVAELFNVNVDAGSDGLQSLTKTFALVLNDNRGNPLANGSATGVETNMVVTAAGGTPLGSMSSDNRTIWLYKVSDTVIIGKIGHDTPGTGDDYVAIRIELTGSAADPQFTVTQYLPVNHTGTSDPDDVRSMLLEDDDASLGISLTVTATDKDGDSHTDTHTVTVVDDGKSIVRVEDDGPQILSTAFGGGVVHDETSGNDGGNDTNTNYASLFSAVTFKGNDPDVNNAFDPAIGYARSQGAIVTAVVDYGTDGKAVANDLTYKIQIGSALTNLQTTDGRNIELFQQGNLIVGRYEVGGNNNPDGSGSDEPAAFAIHIDPATGEVTLVQYVSLKHPTGGSSHDESISLSADNIQVVLTAKDGDGDTVSATVNVGNLIKFEDDGPTLTVTSPQSVANGLFFSGFQDNNGAWGTGSGINTSGTAGAWSITASPVQGAGTVVLEKVGDGYRGSDSPTNSVMVDMEATPGNIQLSQTISGLTAGESYGLSFEIGAANDAAAGSAKLEVIWNGQVVGTYTPTSGVMQTIMINVPALGGNNTLEFREIGAAGDNTGTFLGNVKLNDVIVIDETKGIDPASNEVVAGGVSNLFSSVNGGSDADMPQVQFAQGTSSIVGAVAAFGADGAAATNSLVYALELANDNGVASGLKTTEGQNIVLYKNAAGLIVGVYDADNNGISKDDKVAFALHVNAATGILTIAQYVSLYHPDTNSQDEGVTLAANTISVKVTATDGDGDTASGSADVSGRVLFEDDGPKVTSVVPSAPTLGNELVVNGSFEDGHGLTGSNWEIYSQISGWTMGANNVPFEIQTGGAGGLGADGQGNALVELDGDTQSNGNAEVVPVQNTNATVQQTIAGTEAGQTYQLSFAYSPRGGEGAGSSGMQVWFDGKLVFEIPANNSYPANTWQHFTINVTASGPGAVLQFVGTGSQNELGALLDSVSLKAVYSANLDDEDALGQVVGNQGGPGDDGSGSVAKGKIFFDAGSDGLKSIDATGIAGLKAIYVDPTTHVGTQYAVTGQTWVANGAGGTLTGTIDVPGVGLVKVYTLTIDASGNYTLTMLQPLVHEAPAQGTSFENNLSLNFGFTITDGDGDKETGAINVNVDDDTPEAVTSVPAATVMEEPGSGAVSVQVQTYGFGLAELNQAPNIPNLTTNAGTIVVIAGNGFTLQTAGAGQSMIFTAAAGKTFTIESAAIGLDGSNAGLSQVTLIGFDANGNALAPVTLTVQSNATPGVTPTSVFDATGTVLDGVILSKLEIVPPNPAGFQGRIILDNLELGQVSVTPSQLTTANIDLSPLVNFGEDGAHAGGAFQLKSFAAQDFGSINSGGKEVQIKSDGSKLTGYTSDNAKVFELEIVHGKAVLTLFAPLDHGGASQLNLDFSQFITARDGDGDTIGLAQNAVVFAVKESDLVPTAGTAFAAVDDDGLLGANSAAGTGDVVVSPDTDNNEATFTGTLPGGGGNGALAYSFAGMAGQSGQVGSETVTYSWNAGSNTLTARTVGGSRPGTELFNVQITNPSTGAYKVTLVDNVLHAAADNTEASNSVVPGLNYTVGDSDADTSAADIATGTLNIEFNDDVPTANANTNSVIEGGVVTGNVLTDGTADVFGADGAAAGGGVVGVRASGGDTTTAVTSGINTTITGSFGTLTLQANGTYSYDGNPNVVAPAGATDVFVYTIKDGDGDLSTTTLTINLSDSGIAAPADSDVTVYENALDLGKDGSDLASGTVTGSLPGSTNETDATNQLNATSTAGGLVYTAQTIVGTYGTIKINADGSYIYTLTSPVTGTNANNGANTVSGLENFTYTVTDANGNTKTGSITVSVVDDVPTANANTNSVIEGGVVTGNVLTDGTADVFGADGAAAGGGVVGVRASGGDTTTAVTSGINTTITGSFGTLTLQANGTYSYDGNPNVVAPAGATDVFVYTIKDGDGDLSTTTLTINLSDSGIAAPADSDVTVYENALDLGKDGSDLASGTVTGSLPGSTNETDATNQLNATSTAGGLVYTAQTIVGTYGTIKINADGSYIYTLTSPVTGTNANNGANTVSGLENFTYTVTDANGNTKTGSITVSVVDDVPTANAGAAMTVLETAGSTTGENLLLNDVRGADGASVTHVSFDGGTTWQTVAAGGSTFTPLGGQGTYSIAGDGAWSFDPNINASNSDQNVSFIYRITDGDGDISEATQTITVTNVASPLLLVGSNDGDNTGQPTDHTVPSPQGPADGVLQGGSADDTIIGDPGAVNITQGQSASIALVLDSSGSMTDQIAFGGSTISRMQALKDGTKALIDNLAASGAQNIRITVIDFDTNATNRGTFNLVVNGVVQTAAVTAAKAAVDAMTAGGGTNYEAGLQSAYNWIDGGSGLTTADLKKVVFVSDGNPTYWYDSDGDLDGDGGEGASNVADAQSQVLGSDGTNEPQRIISKGYSIEAIGISVNGTLLGRLSDIEDGNASGGTGAATNATSAAQLAAALTVLGGSTELAAAGNDTINGGDGNDLIFGDVPNTDGLAIQLGVNLPAGSGWAVFQALENRSNNETLDPAGNGADWTRADTLAYLAANHEALSKESGRSGGNDTITGGNGLDIIYGQEGNDVIDGGAGNDIITGGTGKDTMTGGTGADTFRLANGEFVSGESIDGGADGDTIVLTNATTVDFTAGTVTNVEALTGSSGADVVTMSALQWAAFHSVDLAGGTDTLNVQVNGAVDISGATSTSIAGVETRNIVGTAGADSLTLTGAQLMALVGSGTTKSMNLGGGADTITVTDATAIDLTGVTINGVENFKAVGNNANSVTMTALQFAAFSSIDLGAGTDTLNIQVSGSVNFAAIPTLAGVETINFIGTSGNETLTLTGAQFNTLVASGATKIDLGAGSADVLVLSSTSTGLNSLGDGGLMGVETVSAAGAAAGVTINLANQSEVLKIIGSTNADTITGGSAADIISGGGGDDTLTGGSGADQFRLATNTGKDTIADFAAGTDKIGFLDTGSTGSGSVNFAGTSGSQAGNALNVTDFQIRADISGIQGADDNHVILLNTAQTTAQITAGIGANNSQNAYVVVFNSDTGRGEIWFDTDWDNASNRVQVATLNNITSLAGLNALTASDFVVYSSATDPIMLDLDKNGMSFSNVDGGIRFDINADGVADQVAWNTSGDGILAYDVNGDGKIDSGAEIFTPDFAGGHFASGAEALASLDSNGDGIVDVNDEAFSKLMIWQDANSDGVGEMGELTHLSDHGITGLSTTTTASSDFIDGQAVVGEGTVHYADGSSGTYVEVMLDGVLGEANQAQPTGETFVIDGLNVTDIIPDYDGGKGDQLDLSALLSGLAPDTDLAAQGYVSVVQNGADAEVKVDVDGGGDSFQTVAVLENYTAVNEAVKVLFEDNSGTKHSDNV